MYACMRNSTNWPLQHCELSLQTSFKHQMRCSKKGKNMDLTFALAWDRATYQYRWSARSQECAKRTSRFKDVQPRWASSARSNVWRLCLSLIWAQAMRKRSTSPQTACCTPKNIQPTNIEGEVNWSTRSYTGHKRLTNARPSEMQLRQINVLLADSHEFGWKYWCASLFFWLSTPSKLNPLAKGKKECTCGTTHPPSQRCH